MKNLPVLLILFIAAAIGCTAALSTKQAGGPEPRYYAAGYDIVFTKAVNALAKHGWRITFHDFKSGVITGDTVFGGSGVARVITVQIAEVDQKVRVDVSISGNYDTKRYYKREIKRYLNRLNDLLEEYQP